MLKSLVVLLTIAIISSTALAIEKKPAATSKKRILTVSFYEGSVAFNVVAPMKESMRKASKWLEDKDPDQIISVTQTSACVGNTPCSSMVTVVYWEYK